MFASESRLKIVKHPYLGYTCIANEDIKKNDLFYYWGENIDKGRLQRSRRQAERWLVVDKLNDVPISAKYDYFLSGKNFTIDPTPFKESKLQFCNHPGPDEIENLVPTSKTYHKYNLISQEFRATLNIPKGYQVIWNYGEEGWFEDRNIIIRNVGTKKLPVPR